MDAVCTTVICVTIICVAFFAAITVLFLSAMSDI